MLSQVLKGSAMVRVQTWDSQAQAPGAAQQVLEVVWPKVTGTISVGRAEVICVGPADWLVVSADPDSGPLLQSLSEAFRDSPFRATDVSSSLVRIRVESPFARALLSKGCSLDLHPDSFPSGRSARTRFAGMPVVIHCRQTSVFDCIVAASFQHYLLAWLKDAATEFQAASMELRTNPFVRT